MIYIKPVLQVALDVLEVERAIQIAKEAIEGGADWIEAGTPLIKSEGMNAVRELKKALPEVPAEYLKPGLKKIELPSVLNVAVFVHLIQRKLEKKNTEASHA